MSQGGNLTSAEMQRLDPKLVGTTDNAMDTRRSKMAEIFHRGEQWNALRMCLSVRGDPATADKAADILARHGK